MSKRPHADDLRGASRLAVEATKSITAVVEEMHRTIASGPSILGSPLSVPVGILTKVVYGTVRGTTAVVGAALDAALGQLAPLLGESTPGPEREAVRAALNGVLGDYLVATQNSLAIEMQLKMPAQLGKRLLVLVHGSSLNDLQWLQRGHHHGEELAKVSDVTVAALHYNSGEHISTNGRAFAAKLEALTADVSEITLLGHSMGGLVSRSACLIGEEAGHAWRKKLRTLVTLGSPHHGAPLERSGSWLEMLMSINRYSAPLGRLGRVRSAGITDLRFGSIRDEDWHGKDRFAFGDDGRRPVPLPAGVRCLALAGTTSRSEHKRMKSDGLVPVASALGQHRDPAMSLAFSDTAIAYSCGHIDLLSHPDVFAKLRAWLVSR